MNIPLSDAQRRLWFTSQLDSSSAYNIPIVLQLTGPLDRTALVQGIADVVGRHEVLRTVYPLSDDEPYQLVLTPSQLPPLTVLEDCEPAEAQRLVTAHSRHAFDLGAEPPLRCWLIRTAPTEHVLVLVLHHIATDGWSIGPLLRDLGTAYRARLTGGPALWPELSADYADYALWHQELLGDPADADSLSARQTAYWTATLAGLPDEIALPRDRPRPARPSHDGDVVVRHLDAGLHEGLVALARRTDVTLFMLLHTTFALLLHRLGAGTDIPLGTPVAGR
ncbi:MAG: non-ribosomal peptide synthetase, partial [Actinobacteria bacterium]|nr:non-ribosomal peptide synthetase [Actinomycetota bacterium]